MVGMRNGAFWHSGTERETRHTQNGGGGYTLDYKTTNFLLCTSWYTMSIIEFMCIHHNTFIYAYAKFNCCQIVLLLNLELDSVNKIISIHPVEILSHRQSINEMNIKKTFIKHLQPLILDKMHNKSTRVKDKLAWDVNIYVPLIIAKLLIAWHLLRCD